MSLPTPDSPAVPGQPTHPLLQRLRDETRPQHERIERVIRLPATAATLRRTLERFYGFHEPWERAVQAGLGPAAATDLGDRSRVPLLVRDLVALGATPVDLAALPRCDALPPLDSTAAALGSMYVLEGSTLGGQLVARHLEQRLGLSGGLGYSYYVSHGADVGRMWRAFRAALVAHVPAGADGAVVAAAAATFDRLHDWFQSEGDSR